MKFVFALISFTACGKMTSNKNFLFVKNQNFNKNSVLYQVQSSIRTTTSMK